MTRRWSIGIGIMLVSILLLNSGILLPLKAIEKDAIPWGHENVSWPNPFGNLTDFKNKWLERFSDGINLNQTLMEQEWKEWKHRWQEKFNETSKEFKEMWKNVTKIFQKMKQNHSFVGRISYENGYCVGSFVKFIYDEGDILDYTVIREENITVFDFVHVTGFNPKGDPTVHGAVWRVIGDNAFMEVHDNPTSLLKIKALDELNVTMVLHEDLATSLYKSNMIKITGTFEGKIIICGEGNFSSIENDTVDVNLKKNATLVFLAHPEPEVTVKLSNQIIHEEIIHKAISEEKICSLVMISDKNGTDNVTFSNVNISLNVSDGKVKIFIRGEGEGKIIIVEVSNKVINISKYIIVKLDNQTIQEAKNLDELLNASSDGEAKYLLIEGENGIQVLVFIPGFSVHSIDISEMEKISEKTPGFGVAFLVIALLITVLLRRKLPKTKP